jgi:NADPH:quinone reductase
LNRISVRVILGRDFVFEERGMKAIRIHETGGPDVLRYEDVPDPQPAPGQVLVRQSAIGVNFIDAYIRSGLYKGPPLPFIPGVEGGGEVAALGDDVTSLAVGERVTAIGPPGSYAELRVVPAQRLVRGPPTVSDIIGGGTLARGLTVWFLVRRTFPIKRGHTVLWQAAAGGLGLIGGQWAAHLGATLIGTVGSPVKEKIARQHGYTHIINYRTEDVPARVREITGGKGVDVAYDGVGKDTYLQSVQSLRKFGTWVSFGNASGVVPPLDITAMQKGSIYITRPTLFDYIEDPADLQAGAQEYFDLIARGVITTGGLQRIPLSRAAEAHRLLEDQKRQRTGMVVLVP